MSTTPGIGTRRVEHHMGTTISLQTFGASADTEDRFFDEIRSLETRLSRYRSDSEVMQLERGELRLDDASPQVREVMVRCDVMRSQTDGAFDHRPVVAGRPVLDPNALTKGWIIEQATVHLRMAGVRSYFVNAGGDIIVGAPPPGRDAWRVGIAHPHRPDTVFATVDLADAAIATSGRYERGDHIRRAPSAMGRPDELAGVTVVGPELSTADALATAVLAGGEPRPSWWPRETPYGIIAVVASGRVYMTDDLSGLVHVGRRGPGGTDSGEAAVGRAQSPGEGTGDPTGT